MNAETPENNGATVAGWIFYDAHCRFCTGFIQRFGQPWHRRGFRFVPFQMPWVCERLSLTPGAPLQEMRVLLVDGQDVGGADALVALARRVWWAWPMVWLSRLPGGRVVLRKSYRWTAEHRYCLGGRCGIKTSAWAQRRVRPFLDMP